MQCILIFNLFVSSSLFFLEVVVKLSDYFWKPNSLFSKFCVNCLLIFYFVYCNSCALKYVNEASKCTCSLVALRVPEMCFWPAKTGKNFDYFETHTYLWPGAQICFRHKWRKPVAASLLLHFIGGYSCLRYWKEFFSAVFHVLDWSFLVLHLDRNVCNYIPKVISARMDWFWVFLLENRCFHWINICMDWNLQELLNCCFFWRHQFFSMLSLRGILVCSLKMLVLFSHTIL